MVGNCEEGGMSDIGGVANKCEEGFKERVFNMGVAT